MNQEENPLTSWVVSSQLILFFIVLVKLLSKEPSIIEEVITLCYIQQLQM